jgi:hypothetical protein
MLAVVSITTNVYQVAQVETHHLLLPNPATPLPLEEQEARVGYTASSRPRASSTSVLRLTTTT